MCLLENVTSSGIRFSSMVEVVYFPLPGVQRATCFFSYRSPVLHSIWEPHDPLCALPEVAGVQLADPFVPTSIYLFTQQTFSAHKMALALHAPQ